MEVTDFILKCGYDVHCRNHLQETPLHIASKTENFSSNVAIKLLEHGAHLDTPDVRDICPIDILKAQPNKINVVPYVSLKCLAAQVIVKERVTFEPHEMPEHLDKMLQMHVPNLPALYALDLDECCSDISI